MPHGAVLCFLHVTQLWSICIVLTHIYTKHKLITNPYDSFADGEFFFYCRKIIVRQAVLGERRASLHCLPLETIRIVRRVNPNSTVVLECQNCNNSHHNSMLNTVMISNLPQCQCHNKIFSNSYGFEKYQIFIVLKSVAIQFKLR